MSNMLGSKSIQDTRKIETTIVDNKEELKSCLQALQASITKANSDGVKCVVGLDIIPGEQGSVDELILASATNCLILLLNQWEPGFPKLLFHYLHSPSISFVAVRIEFVLDALKKSCNLFCRGEVDLCSLAADLEAFGLVMQDQNQTGLGGSECGVRCVDKPQCC